MSENPWRIVTWSDENYRIIKELGCHERELSEVLSLPFPQGAVVRDAVMALTSLTRAKAYRWHRRYPAVVRMGEFFQEDINQGLRDCEVIAVDESTGDFLYEYEMPGGRTFLRNSAGMPVNRRTLAKKWRRIIEGEDQSHA